MRVITTDERDLNAATKLNIHVRVLVYQYHAEPHDGTAVELTTLGGYNWFQSIKWDVSLDTFIASGTLTLRRKIADQSLAPLIEASGYNIVDGDFAPLLYPGRRFLVFTALTEPGVAPVTGDWKEVLYCRMDKPSWGKRDDTVVITFSGIESLLSSTFIKPNPDREDGKWPHSTNEILPGNIYPGKLLEDVIDEVLGFHTDPLLNVPISVYAPVSSEWYITEFGIDPGNLYESVRNLALQRGWDLRHRFIDDHPDGPSYYLTLYNPNRDATVADTVIGMSEYDEITQLELSDENVRNEVDVEWTDDVGEIHRISDQNDDSRKQFGPKYMKVGLGGTDNINTEGEATILLASILSDISYPDATQEVSLIYSWYLEINDIIEFPGNGEHYDTIKHLAVTSLSHSIEDGDGTTTIGLRGKPAAAASNWLTKATNGLTDAPRVIWHYAKVNDDTLALEIRAGGNASTIGFDLYVKDSPEDTYPTDPTDTIIANPVLFSMDIPDASIIYKLVPKGTGTFGPSVEGQWIPAVPSQSLSAGISIDDETGDASLVIVRTNPSILSVKYRVSEISFDDAVNGTQATANFDGDNPVLTIALGTFAIETRLYGSVIGYDEIDGDGAILGSVLVQTFLPDNSRQGLYGIHEILSARTATTQTWGWFRYPGVFVLVIFNVLRDLIGGALDWPSAEGGDPYEVRGPLDDFGVMETITVDHPPYRHIRLLQLEPRDTALAAVGPIEHIRIMPPAAAEPTIDHLATFPGSYPRASVAGRVYNPDVPAEAGTLYVWSAKGVGTSPDPSANPDGYVTYASTPFVFGPTTAFTPFAGGATVQYLNGILFRPGSTKTIFLRADTPDGRSQGQVAYTLENLLTIIDPDGTLTVGAIQRPNQFLEHVVEETAIALRSIGSDRLKLNGVERENIIDRAINAAKVGLGGLNDPDIFGDVIIEGRMIVDGTIIADHLNIAMLSDIAADVGIVIHGELRNAPGTRYIDLDAIDDEYFIKFDDKFGLIASGLALFNGTIGVDTLIAGRIIASEHIRTDGLDDPAIFADGAIAARSLIIEHHTVTGFVTGLGTANVSWVSLKIFYGGVSYTIANGSRDSIGGGVASNAIWFDRSASTLNASSSGAPTGLNEADGDALIFIRDTEVDDLGAGGGVWTRAWNQTLITGNGIRTESIIGRNIAVGAITTDHLNVSVDAHIATLSTTTFYTELALITELSEISPNAGIIVSGELHNVDNTHRLNLDATVLGNEIALELPGLVSRASGTIFSGTLSGDAADFVEVTATYITTTAITAEHAVIETLVTDSITSAFGAFDVLTALQATITSLSGINADFGTITAGVITGSTLSLNFDAISSEHELVFDHSAFQLWSDGPAIFSGTVSSDTFTADEANFKTINVGGAHPIYVDIVTIQFFAGSDVGTLKYTNVGSIGVSGTYNSRFYFEASPGGPVLLAVSGLSVTSIEVQNLWWGDKQVSEYNINTAGSGYRALRVPNS